MNENKKVALIIGAGDATGGAIARRFAREGYVACVTRRSLDKLQPLLELPQRRLGVGRVPHTPLPQQCFRELRAFLLR